MNYDVYLLVTRTGRTHAHVPALPGCNWRGDSPEEAWQRAPLAIAAHLAWLSHHNQPAPPPEEPVIPRLAAQLEASGDGMVGFFESDRQPVSSAEIQAFLQLMNCARRDLLALTHDLPDVLLDASPDPNSWSIRQVLRHVASAERWYLTRILDPATLPRFKPRKSVFERLEMVRALAVERLQALSEAERSAVIKRDGELWTARKVFRRFLEHEREHTAHILEILNHFTELDRR